MKLIPLTQNKFAIIDDEDFVLVNQYKWNASKQGNNWYACRLSSNYVNGKRLPMRIHRLVMNAKAGQQIDHRDGNALDNRKANLRFATNSQNVANSVPYQNRTSLYKGVYWHKIGHKWRVQICINNNRMHLGLYDNEIIAAWVYDKIALESFGEFAKTNFLN